MLTSACRRTWPMATPLMRGVMSKTKTSDAAGFICANCSNIDLGPCDLEKALVEFDQAPWKQELINFEKLDGTRPIPCWPDLTFRIGSYHIGYMLEPDATRFRVEVCMPRPRKILGIFRGTKFFEFKNVETSRAREYLRKFYTLTYSEQHEYYAQQKQCYS